MRALPRTHLLLAATLAATPGCHVRIERTSSTSSGEITASVSGQEDPDSRAKAAVIETLRKKIATASQLVVTAEQQVARARNLASMGRLPHHGVQAMEAELLLARLRVLDYRRRLAVRSNEHRDAISAVKEGLRTARQLTEMQASRLERLRRLPASVSPEELWKAERDAVEAQLVRLDWEQWHRESKRSR